MHLELVAFCLICRTNVDVVEVVDDDVGSVDVVKVVVDVVEVVVGGCGGVVTGNNGVCQSCIGSVY